jgi:hypothetical protein
MNEVTRILSTIDQGDPHAAALLLPLVSGEKNPFSPHFRSLHANRESAPRNMAFSVYFH